MAEDVLFVWNLPLGEKNLCICVPMKWKKGESWKPETIFRYLRRVKSKSFEHCDLQGALINPGVLIKSCALAARPRPNLYTCYKVSINRATEGMKVPCTY